MSNYDGNTLITLHNIAHTANHLLTVQLINSPSAPSTKTNFKPQHFYFLTLAPGAGSGSNRTYDFQSKINMKFSIAEIFSLSFVLQQCSIGNSARVLPYSKFSKSSTGQKIVSIIESAKQTQAGPSRQITIFVGCDGQKHSINLPPDGAYALAKQLELSATDATKMEFNRLASCPNVNSVRTQPIPNQEPLAPQPPIYQQPPLQASQPLQSPPSTHPLPQQPIQQNGVNAVVNQFDNVLNSRL